MYYLFKVFLNNGTIYMHPILAIPSPKLPDYEAVKMRAVALHPGYHVTSVQYVSCAPVFHLVNKGDL